MKNKLHLKC